MPLDILWDIIKASPNYQKRPLNPKKYRKRIRKRPKVVDNPVRTGYLYP